METKVTSAHYQFEIKANATTEIFWSLSIELDGYIPICWSISHSYSTSIPVGVERFDTNSIAGFYLNPSTNSTLAHVYVVYLKL